MNILVIGTGPLPEENKQVNAAGLRTQQFLDALLFEKKEHKTAVVLFEQDRFDFVRIHPESPFLSHISLSRHHIRWKTILREQIKKYKPEIIVGVNTLGSFLARQVMPKKTLFWADLNGWAMAEAQAQSSALKTNAFLPHIWGMESSVVKRANFFSVVTKSQKHALYGELAALGRLHKDNFGEDIVEVIPNSCRPLSSFEREKKQEKLFRGKLFPVDAFALLWIGGMNAWADEKTLFIALEKSMLENKKIHFVMTGGVLRGIDEESFPRFQERVKHSDFANQFHFLDWVKTEDFPSLFWECDAGINIDRPCVETTFGARNRLNEMLRYSLPIISTTGTEVMSYIVERGGGISCDMSDPAGISQAILSLSHGEEEQEERRKAQEDLRKNDFSGRITTKGFRQWIRNPQKNTFLSVSLSRGGRVGAGISYWKQRGTKSFFHKLWHLFASKLG